MGSTSANHPLTEPIAIVGLSCKFAGDARDAQGFWRLLSESRSAWSEIPESRFNAKGVYHANPERNGTMNVLGGHFIDDDLAHFDAAFFSLSAETAAALDPQFRLQLESVYEAIENAGLSLAQLAGSPTAVYAGITVQDYKDNLVRDGDNLPRNYAIGTGSAFAANRVSHFFDLRGASMSSLLTSLPTIDTGCSTTLVALHQAVCTLRNRESDMAIVGGSNLMLNPDTFNSMSSGNFLSKDGRSYAFDSRANGYSRGDGVATIIVKRLSDALKDGDPIRAVVRETALNQDGKTESITSPSQVAQTALMRECYKRAGLDPRDTQYFEAHGTGTPTGDLIEAGAMAAMFKHGRSLEQSLLIGSAKTNIGHTETTSGLAGIIKMILSMEHGLLPASVNLKEVNPKIPFDDWRLKLVSKPTPWPTRPGQPKRASINNFGYGGSNAHIIMESVDDWTPYANGHSAIKEEESSPGLLILSAKSEQACKAMVSNMKDYIEEHLDSSDPRRLLESVIYTLGQRRTLFSWVAAQPVQLDSDLAAVSKALNPTQFRPARASRKPRVGFAFTGQGAQWHAMGRELLEAYPTFRMTLKTADVLLQRIGAEWSLLDELQRGAKETKVNDTSMSIPVCVAVQIALVDTLRTWGIEPAAVTCHSSGEIAAAYTVGALDLRSAMAVAYHRAELTARYNATQAVKGGMIAVGLGEDETEEYLAKLKCGGKAVAACINSPSSVTVAGDVSAIEEIEATMKADGVFARRLKVNAAYHSHHMEPVAEPYQDALAKEQLSGPNTGALDSIAYSSAVTGDRILDAEILREPEHWVASMVQPVQFVEAFTDLVLGDFDPSGSSVDVMVEIGPHTALGSAMKDILALPVFNGVQIPYYGSLVRNTDARQSMQSLAAALLGQGQQLNVESINFPKGLPSHVCVATDLPQYPWVHETRHWQENRLNRAFRQRSHAPHDLLGSEASWSNPMAPMWRNIIRLNDCGWLRDHVVESDVVYPGAAFACLAIEAMARWSATQQDQTSFSGYHLREVNLEAALVLLDKADGTELQTILSPADDKEIAYKGWKKFEIISVTAEGDWTHHAQGRIRGETEPRPAKPTAEVPGSTRDFEPDDLYANLRKVGIKHGPIFQNISKILTSREHKESLCEISPAKTEHSQSLPTNCVMQPITLDTIVQAAYTALPQAGSQLASAMVPRSIDSLWISTKTPCQGQASLKARSSVLHEDSQIFRVDISTVDRSDESLVVEIKNLTFQSLGQAVTVASAKPWETEICNRLEWVQDTTLESWNDLKSMERTLRHDSNPEEGRMIEDLRRVSVYYAQDMLDQVHPSTVPKLEGFFQKYYSWSQNQVELAEAGKLGHDSATWTKDSADVRRQCIEEVRNASVNGEMVVHLGPHLAAMVKGEQAPLELMMEDRLLTKYYRQVLKWHRSFQDAAHLLRGIVHHNPQARILEIGAGTGGGTHYMLSAIGSTENGGPLASAYHFTDISTGFFEAASKEFAPWGDLIQYSKLDVEQDPIAQGFEYGSYDVVVACQVLHATQSMRKTMANVRKLMKPGGKLLLVETTQDQLDVQFVFGLLPGWWLSEEAERFNSPNLTVESWNNVLKDTGFTGLEIEVPDCSDEASYATSAMMSSARTPQEKTLPTADQFVVVTSGSQPPPEGWLEALRSVFRKNDDQSLDISVQSLESGEKDVYDGKICVFLGEAGVEPILHRLRSEELEAIQAMATKCQGLLWLTRGGALECTTPSHSLAAGFLRALRNEYVGRKMIILDLDPKLPAWYAGAVSAVYQVLSTTFGAVASSNTAVEQALDFEYAHRDGRVLVPRVLKDPVMNKAVSPDHPDELVIESAPLQQSLRPLQLQVSNPGMLETIAFGDDQRPCCTAQELAKDTLKVEPRAYGLNFRDVMVAMGQLEERVMGLECAGTVVQAGEDAVAQGFAVGDAVMCLLDGPFASHAYVPWRKTVHMSGTLNFEEAASIPLVFTTAHYSLYEVARLKPGQSILIHAAAGGVGQAAIMLAQHIGATIFATVGSTEKKNLLTETYGIEADHIFSSRSTSFVEDVLAATDSRGVDVVLNSLSGPLLQAGFDILAPFGHFVEIGKSDLERNSSLAMHTFARHVSFSSVDVLAMLRHREYEIHSILRKVAQMTAQNIIKPVAPVTVYPMANVSKAFRLLQTGRHTGKVVLSISPDEVIPVIPQQPTVRLLQDAAYLLVGGVGGVGISIARWMIQHGAKNLIFISRSAGKGGSTAAIEEQARQTGCRLKGISCDISDLAALRKALAECQRDGLPPVRGIVQGAMVLKDAILESMSLQDYEAAIGPKVAGSWNLHAAFPNAKDLDFFIMLSSMVGILGNASQANYAAAGSYQDALATWRQRQGLSCVSIDLATVKSVGYVDQNAGVRNRMAKLGHAWLDEDTVHGILASAILDPRSPQIIAGINEGPGAHWDSDGSSQLGRDARFAALRYRQPRQQARSGGAADGGDSLAGRLAEAATKGEVEQLVLEALTLKLSDIFMISPADIDASRMPADYGVDSLVAVELRTMLTNKVGSDLSSIVIMQSPSIGALAKEAAGRSRHVSASAK